MEILSNPSRIEKLANLFDEVGKQVKISDVLEITNIPNYNTLKALCTYIRRSKSIPDENRVDLRIKGEFCMRVQHERL